MSESYILVVSMLVALGFAFAACTQSDGSQKSVSRREAWSKMAIAFTVGGVVVAICVHGIYMWECS